MNFPLFVLSPSQLTLTAPSSEGAKGGLCPPKIPSHRMKKERAKSALFFILLRFAVHVQLHLADAIDA